jgi:hypothetical protein
VPEVATSQRSKFSCPTSAMGLGCVKTAPRNHRRVAISAVVAIRGHFQISQLFCSRPVLERVAEARLAVCSGYYALIAAISGWIPMMFMTRVRL